MGVLRNSTPLQAGSVAKYSATPAPVPMIHWTRVSTIVMATVWPDVTPTSLSEARRRARAWAPRRVAEVPREKMGMTSSAAAKIPSDRYRSR
jgi:hypothetical protein